MKISNIFFFCTALLLAACGRGPAADSDIVEQKNGEAQIEGLELKQNARYREAVGMRFSARVNLAADKRPYWFQLRLLNAAGEPLKTTEILRKGDRYQPRRDALAEYLEWNTFDGKPRFGADPVPSPDKSVWIILPVDSVGKPDVEGFIPWPWLGLKPGKHELQAEMRGFKGKWNGAIPGPTEPDALLRMKFSIEVPALYKMQVNVPEVVLNTDKFDPHASDYVLLAARKNYGYPDPFWALEMDGETVYRSAKVKNEVTARYTEPSYTIWVQDKNAKVKLCVFDWDEKRVLNGDDPMGCWEGPLSTLSTRAAAPSRPAPDKVKSMQVWLNWMP